MSNRAWMPLHVGDYLKDTGHLSAAEHGAYLLLIMHYWDNGTLPADEGLIRRIAKLSSTEWAESRDVLAALFLEGWRHKRIDAELAKAEDIIAKRRAAAEQKHSKTPAKAEQVQSKSSDTRVPTLDQVPTEKGTPDGVPKKRATRLSADWQIPEPWIEEAIAAGLSRGQASAEATRMLNWSLGDKNGAKLDWLATWRNWFDRAAKQPPRQATSPPGKPRNAGESARQELRELGMLNATDESTRRLGEGQRGEHPPGTGIARRFAISSG